MDLCTLGMFVGAILSTVRRAFFVGRRSASGASQRGYDFKPPGFSHGSWYPENQLFRCSIQPDSVPLPVFFVSGWFGSDNPARIICLYLYLSFLSFIFRNARVTGSTAVLGPMLGPPMLGPPMLGPLHVGHPVNERSAGTSEVQLFATAETTAYSGIAERAGKGRAAGRPRTG